ncbi:MAG: EFR1 family ferrodoxin [Bacillota bacterium]|nr:EFR1 family ferrodoxin [Bacillota bacterium]
MADTTIYYFSGTGNSYYVASALQKKLKDCNMVAITQVYKNSQIDPESKRVGFVFPLYFQSMPKVVMDLVDKINLSKAEYVFAVVTRGGKGYQGGVLRHMKKLLKDKNVELNLGQYIQLPDNYLPILKVPKEAARKKMFMMAEGKIETIARSINSDSNIMENEVASFLRPLMHNRFLKNLNSVDEGFYINEKCNSCGMCEKICKFDNIKLDNGKPKWQHNCQLCLACMNYCPVSAIEHGRSKGKERYNHPAVPAKEYLKI